MSDERVELKEEARSEEATIRNAGGHVYVSGHLRCAFDGRPNANFGEPIRTQLVRGVNAIPHSHWGECVG